MATRSECVLAPELVHWRLVVVWKCAMLPFISTDHFRLLLDGTGKPFAEFMDRVLRATAAKLGVAPAHVHTNLRVNLADGGVDTQIDQGNDPEGHLAGPTIWQFKGRRFADVPRPTFARRFSERASSTHRT